MAPRLVCTGEEMIKKSHLGPFHLRPAVLCEWHMCMCACACPYVCVHAHLNVCLRVCECDGNTDSSNL